MQKTVSASNVTLSTSATPTTTSRTAPMEVENSTTQTTATLERKLTKWGLALVEKLEDQAFLTDSDDGSVITEKHYDEAMHAVYQIVEGDLKDQLKVIEGANSDGELDLYECPPSPALTT